MDDRQALSRAFIERWVTKAQQYDPAFLDQAFDKFFTLFVAFNRLYFYHSERLGHPNSSDRTMATATLPSALGADTLWAGLSTDGGLHDVQALGKSIGPGGTFQLSSSPRGQPDEAADARLQAQILEGSIPIRVRGVLTYIYLVRCNVFHGRKALEDRQQAILHPTIRCLSRIVDVGLRRLTNAA